MYVVAKIALHFKDERGRSPLGIVGLPAQKLARERVHTGGCFAGPDSAEDRHARIESALGDGQPFGALAFDGVYRVVNLADDNGGRVGGRRKWPRGEPGPEPQAHPKAGEPDPRHADEELAREEHGYARREVVPRDDGAIRDRRVVADENGDGIGLGKRAGPRPRGSGADAADDEEGA